MRIALIQNRQNRLYDFADPHRRYDPAEACALQAEMIEQTEALLSGIQEPCDLIITPEAVNFPGSPERIQGDWTACIDGPDAPWLTAYARHARRLGAYLVVGAYTKRDDGVFNSACVYDRAGRQIALYEKIHLAGSEQVTLVAGSEPALIDADFGRFGICVCWDMQFPELCRLYALRGAQLVVCPTWGWEWLYANARAYENGIFVAGAMGVPYGGTIEGVRSPSQVIGPDGVVIAGGPKDSAAVVFAEIELAGSDVPRALRMGDRRPTLYGGLCDIKDMG